MSNNTILEANANTANEAKYKKSITVSNGTYNRLLKAGRFSDRSFDKVIARLWQKGFTGREIILEMPAKQSPQQPFQDEPLTRDWLLVKRMSLPTSNSILKMLVLRRSEIHF